MTKQEATLVLKLLDAIRYNIEPTEVGQNVELMVNLQYIGEEFEQLDQYLLDDITRNGYIKSTKGIVTNAKRA